MQYLFKFKKGQPVPPWLQLVTVGGKVIEGCFIFNTRGKLAVINGDVYIWPAKKHFFSIMHLSNLRNASVQIYGGGIQRVGMVHMSGYIRTKGRYWNPSKAIKMSIPASFKNSVKALPLPYYFDRESTVINKEKENEQ